jgi:hypothetical protein
MPKGIFIPADDAQPLEVREFNGLPDYQAAVTGWIEAIDLDTLNATFFTNYEAKIIGLPINRRATLMWWLDSPHIRHRDTIGGNVCLIGLPDEEGDTQDAPEEVFTLLFETESYKAMFQTADDPEAFNGNQMRFINYFEAVNYALVKFDQWAAVERCKVVPA